VPGVGFTGGVDELEEDRRGLSPLFWSHVNRYGRFRLDMDTRLDLTAA
jgi:hypothetical protein